jgi:1-phosphatidylinositol phosphodiesterase
VQLADGIRVLDIRLAIKDGHLVAYHGRYPERATFQSILGSLHTFLTNPSSAREAIVVSMKQEDYHIHSPEAFSTLLREEIEAGPGGIGMWFLENRVPTLGEVRGKVILFNRFGGDGAAWEGGREGTGIWPEGTGIRPPIWPDSAEEGFSWKCKDVLVRTQDWCVAPFSYVASCQ